MAWWSMLVATQAIAASLLVGLIGAGLIVAQTDAEPEGAAPPEVPSATEPPVEDALPEALLAFIHFEPNLGQAPDSILWIGRAPGVDVLVMDDRIRLVADGAVDLVFGPLTASGAAPTGAVANHYVGDVALSGVPTYRQVRLATPGVETILHASSGTLRFDHIVAPGADPALASFRVEGATPRMDGGDLVLETQDGAFRLGAPFTFQDVGGARVEVASGFAVADDRVGYALGPYDTSLPLVIDPAVKYSSLLGVTGNDDVRGLKVVDPPAPTDPDHRWVFVGGHVASSTNFPAGMTPNSRTGPGGGRDTFVARLTFDLADRSLTPDWFTYFGGSSTDDLNDLDALPDGTVAITGSTMSTNLPTMNAVVLVVQGQTLFNGNSYHTTEDAYASMFSATGALTFSTYLYSDNYDRGTSVLLDGVGGLYVGGYCYCSWGDSTARFPATPDSAQPVSKSWVYDEGFLSHIDTTTSPSSFRFSTFLGGGVYDQIYDVAADATGVYVTGATQFNPTACAVVATYCPPFPTTPGAYQLTHAPSTATTIRTSAFLTKFSPDGKEILFSTMFGGTGGEVGLSVSVTGGEAWVVGTTASLDLPVCPAECVAGAPAPLQPNRQGSSDAFLTRFAADGSALEYSTYFGTTTTDRDVRHRAAPNGDLLVAIEATAGAAVTPGGIYTSGAGGDEIYIARVDPSTPAVRFGTWLGGTQAETFHRALALDDQGNIYVGGSTKSTGATQLFPRVGQIQTAAAGSDEGFMTIMGKKWPTAILTASAAGHGSLSSPSATPFQVPKGTPVAFDATGSLPGDLAIDFALTEWSLSGGGPPLTSTGTVASFDPFTLNVAGTRTVCATVWDMDVPGAYDRSDTACLDIEWQNAGPTAAFTAGAYVATGVQLAFTDASTDSDGTISSWSWNFGDTSTSTQQHPSHAWTQAGTYTVTLTVMDDDGAPATATWVVEVLDPPVADFSMPATTVAGQPIVVSDSSSAGTRPIQTRAWTLGDGGQQGDVLSFSHTYATGTYTVTLTVDDGILQDTAQRTIIVSASAIAALPDSYTTVQETTLSVPSPGILANDAAGTTAQLVGDVSSGTLALAANGGFTYTPDDGFTGTDSFTYKATTANGASPPVTVTITVTGFAPPAASFTYQRVGTTVTFTDTSTPGQNGIASWLWDFDDDSGADVPSPTHVFEPGTYTVRLTITDAAQLTATTTRTITVAETSGGTAPQLDPIGTIGPLGGTWVGLDKPAPPIPNRAPVADIQAPATVLPGTLVRLDATGSNDPDGDMFVATWTVLDGTADLSPHDLVATFIAPESGTVRLALHVHDGTLSDTAETTIAVVPMPAPRIETAAEGPLAVRFTDASGAPGTIERVWLFGDGGSGRGEVLQHTFQQPGMYLVTLRLESGGHVRETTTMVPVAGPTFTEDAPGQDAPVDPAPADAEAQEFAGSASRQASIPLWAIVAGAVLEAIVVGGAVFMFSKR